MLSPKTSNDAPFFNSINANCKTKNFIFLSLKHIENRSPSHTYLGECFSETEIIFFSKQIQNEYEQNPVEAKQIIKETVNNIIEECVKILPVRGGFPQGQQQFQQFPPFQPQPQFQQQPQGQPISGFGVQSLDQPQQPNTTTGAKLKNENEAKKWNTSLGVLPDTFFDCLKEMGSGIIDTSSLAEKILSKIATSRFHKGTELFTVSKNGFQVSGRGCFEARSIGTLEDLLKNYCNYVLTGKKSWDFCKNFEEVFANALIYDNENVIYGKKDEYYEEHFEGYKTILSNTEKALNMPKDPTGGKLYGLEDFKIECIKTITQEPDEIIYVVNNTLNKIPYKNFLKLYEAVISNPEEITESDIKQLPYYILALRFRLTIEHDFSLNKYFLIIQSEDAVQTKIKYLRDLLKRSPNCEKLMEKLEQEEEDRLSNREAIVAKRGGLKKFKNKNLKKQIISKILHEITNNLKSPSPSGELKYCECNYAATAIEKAYKNVPGLKELLTKIKACKYENSTGSKIEALAKECCDPKKYGYSAYGINLIMTTLFNFDCCRKKLLSLQESDNIATTKKTVKEAFDKINDLNNTISKLKQKSHKTPTITNKDILGKINQIAESIKQNEKCLAQKTNNYIVLNAINGAYYV